MPFVRKVSFGMLASVASAVAVLNTPVALADGGHHDRDRGRDANEHAIVVVHHATPVGVKKDIDDDDANEDRAEVQVEPAQVQTVVDVEHEDVNDDND